jgi:hypothetical protein
MLVNRKFNRKLGFVSFLLQKNVSYFIFFKYDLMLKEDFIFYRLYYIKSHQYHHHNDHDHRIGVFWRYNSCFYRRKNQDFEDKLQQLKESDE